MSPRVVDEEAECFFLTGSANGLCFTLGESSISVMAADWLDSRTLPLELAMEVPSEDKLGEESVAELSTLLGGCKTTLGVLEDGFSSAMVVGVLEPAVLLETLAFLLFLVTLTGRATPLRATMELRPSLPPEEEEEEEEED